jgi:putative ABC transport system permease protein
MSHLKSAFRFIRTHPLFSSLIVLTLALGIGLNSAIFSIVDGILFRPMLYKDQDNLFRIIEYNQAASAAGNYDLYFTSYQNFVAWREQSRSFDRMDALESAFHDLTGGKGPESVATSVMTDGFFDMLGAKPALGRLFLPAEYRPGAPPVAVLGQELFQRRFGGNPDIVGQSIVLDGKSYTVVGVTRPGFFFRVYADLFLPMPVNAANPPYPPGARYLYVTGHLRPGVSVAAARSEMQTIAARLAKDHPETNANWGIQLMTVRDNLVGDMRPALILLMAAVVLVLFIACSNVANLLLNQVVRQRGELALRSALGAGRGRLIRQIVTESTLLALLGGVLGIALATVFIRALPKISPTQILLMREIRIDYRVFAFTLVISLLCGLLPGLFVAFRGARLDLYADLKGAGQRSTDGVENRRLQGALVVAEVALTLVLLACCGLVLKSFSRLSQVSPGFDPQGIFLGQISLPSWKYKDPNQIRAFWRDLTPRLEALPGVVSVGVTHVLPVNDTPLTINFDVAGRPPASADESLSANFRKVTPGFFKTLRIPLVSGRFFDDHDDEQHERVVIVSQEMVRRFWPNTSPLGKQIKRRIGGGQLLTVVGVVSDVQDGLPGAKFGNTLYIPFIQDPKSNKPSVHLLVRTTGKPLDLAPAVTRAVLAVDSDQPLDKATTMEQWVFSSLSKKRFSAWILTLFAGLAIVLSVVGIYGVLSYSVSRRQHEMGVRLALGAQAKDVIKVVLWQGMSLTGLGIVIGLVLAVASSRFLTSLLYEVTPSDPLVFVWIVVGLAAVSLLASYLPARRAARVDPIRSLNQE